MDRRTFLSTTAGVGLVAGAGCTASATKRPPKVADDATSGGWEQTGTERGIVFERTYEGATVTASASTRLFENTGLAAEVKEKTLGEVEGQLASFFATRVTFDPNVAGLPASVAEDELVERTETSAKETFRSRLEGAGLSEVEVTGEGTFDVDTGESARRTDFRAAFPFDDISFPLREGHTATVEGGAVDVAGTLAVWEHDDAVLVAGGAYPATNFERHVEQSLSEAIHVSVDVDVGLTPSTYRTELNSFVAQVE